MELPLYHLDAFADRSFTGNPAAVCPLPTWLPDALMQQIAGENNLAETAFYVRAQNGLAIRWFTPVAEVDLCGHATLAAAFVALERGDGGRDSIVFSSPSGALTVNRRGDDLELDFPVDTFAAVRTPDAIVSAMGGPPRECYRGKTDYMIVYDDEDRIAALTPDPSPIVTLDCRGVIATAPGRTVDFVSRFFAPNVGIPEDPVTGSAHTTLTPYWARRLGRSTLSARQISKRGGSLRCGLAGDRVHIAGRVIPYLSGRIVVDVPEP